MNKKISFKILSIEDVKGIIEMLSLQEEEFYIIREYKKTAKMEKLLNDFPDEIRWFNIELKDNPYNSKIKFSTKLNESHKSNLIFNNYKNFIRKKKLKRINENIR